MWPFVHASDLVALLPSTSCHGRHRPLSCHADKNVGPMFTFPFVNVHRFY